MDKCHGLSKSSGVGWIVNDYLLLKPIHDRLLDHADADRALKNPSRVMRLPGTYHMNEDGSAGGLTTIINQTDKLYSVKDIESCLPTAKVHEQIKRSSEYKDYRKEPIDVVEKCLRGIPNELIFSMTSLETLP